MQHELRNRTNLRWPIAAIAVTVLSVSAGAQSPSNTSVVTVYDSPNFSGQQASFGDDTPTLAASGLNDKISSIQIPAGETWEVCQDVDYLSKCQVLSSNTPDLGSMGWNDQISSLRRVDNGAFALTLYAKDNFHGERLLFDDDTPTLVASMLNGKSSSIDIPAGQTWEVCQAIDYGSPCQVLSSSVSDLRSTGWADRISSLRRIDTRRLAGRADLATRSTAGDASDVQQSLVFFSQTGFEGTSSSFVSGKVDLGFPAREGSVRVRGGGAWELCDQSRRCATIDQDVADVSELRLKGRITTAWAVDSTQNRRTGSPERIR